MLSRFRQFFLCLCIIILWLCTHMTDSADTLGVRFFDFSSFTFKIFFYNHHCRFSNAKSWRVCIYSFCIFMILTWFHRSIAHLLVAVDRSCIISLLQKLHTTCAVIVILSYIYHHYLITGQRDQYRSPNTLTLGVGCRRCWNIKMMTTRIRR